MNEPMSSAAIREANRSTGRIAPEVRRRALVITAALAVIGFVFGPSMAGQNPRQADGHVTVPRRG